jgi:hypothetical protein
VELHLLSGAKAAAKIIQGVFFSYVSQLMTVIYFFLGATVASSGMHGQISFLKSN